MNDLQRDRHSRGRTIGSGSSPTFPPYYVNSTGVTQEDWERDNLLTGDGVGGGGRGAEPYHRKKALSSINHSILSGVDPGTLLVPRVLGEVGEVQRHDAVLMVENT